MAVKVFCNKCNKEIWQGLTDPKQLNDFRSAIKIKNTNLAECMNVLCSDCLLQEIVDARLAEEKKLQERINQITIESEMCVIWY